jgi:hypothetical protein
MTGTETDLLAIEKKFWTGDDAYYREHVDTTCLVAFAEMSGLLSNRDLAATVKDGNRWKTLEFDSKGVVRPTDDIAIHLRGDGRTRHRRAPPRHRQHRLCQAQRRLEDDVPFPDAAWRRREEAGRLTVRLPGIRARSPPRP